MLIYILLIALFFTGAFFTFRYYLIGTYIGVFTIIYIFILVIIGLFSSMSYHITLTTYTELQDNIKYITDTEDYEIFLSWTTNKVNKSITENRLCYDDPWIGIFYSKKIANLKKIFFVNGEVIIEKDWEEIP